MRTCAVLCLTVGLGLAPFSGTCAWRFIGLTKPEHPFQGNIHATNGTTHYGFQDVNFRREGTAWGDHYETATSFTPAGWTHSTVYATHGDWQAGEAVIGTRNHPVMWNGTAGSMVSLLPSTVYGGTILGMDGQSQVGEVVAQNFYAALWRGTKESYVNLHPDSARSSQAVAVEGDVQCGRTGYEYGKPVRAALWRGSKESYVDMHPSWSTGGSAISAIEGGKQYGGAGSQACFWSGTPDSAISMHPEGYLTSYIFAAKGGVQFGVCQVAGPASSRRDRLGYWRGSASSWVDLTEYLPANWSRFQVWCGWSDGERIVLGGNVSGPGYNSQAFVLTNVVPEPNAIFALSLGVLMVRKRKKAR